MTLWAFGDSFMSYDANYIRDIATAAQCDKVRVYGKPGTGLLFTYQAILSVLDKIEQDDLVIIGLSDMSRHLFGPTKIWDVMLAGVSRKRAPNKETYQAAVDYYKYLYREDHVSKLAHAVVSSLIYNIVPSLNTHRVSVIRCLSTPTTVSKLLPKYLFDDIYRPCLYNVAKVFLIKHKGYKGDDNVGIMKVIGTTKNHWIDNEPDYPKFFYSRMRWMLEELQLDEGAILSLTEGATPESYNNLI